MWIIEKHCSKSLLVTSGDNFLFWAIDIKFDVKIIHFFHILQLFIESAPAAAFRLANGI
jgi:hypothetical protein